MALDDFDQHDPAETYPGRARRRRRRIPFTGPVILMVAGMGIALLTTGALAGAWMTGTIDGPTMLRDLVVVACMTAAMAFFTGRDWLSDRDRKRGESERLATVMIWHTDRAEENREILAAVRALSPTAALRSVEGRLARQEGEMAGVQRQISAAVVGAFNPDTSATIHSLNRDLNGHRPL